MRMKWNCRKIRSLLWDDAAGRLTETQRDRVAGHLQGCARCRQQAQKVAHIVAPIAVERQRGLPEIPGVWQAIQFRLDRPAAAQALPPASFGSLARRSAFIAGFAALCGVGAFAFRQISAGCLNKPLEKPTPQIITAQNPPTTQAQNKTTQSSGNGAASKRPDRSPPLRQAASLRDKPGKLNAPRPRSFGVPAAPQIADALYLNGQDAPAPKFAVIDAADTSRPSDALPRFRDDFILAEPPRIAGAGSDAQQKQQDAAALREYNRQMAIVDTRLFRKVTLAEKGESIATICAHLQAQTGVKLRGLQDVEDEKLTIFVEKMPARDVMRAISRLLGYKWMRYGTEGAFFYRLTQPMRSRLAEEEMRSQDDNAALLALDEEMGRKRTEAEQLDAQIAALKHLPAPPSKEEKEERKARIAALEASKAAQKNSPMVSVYEQLTPADKVALRGGAEIGLDPDDPQTERQIAPELQKQMCAGFPDVYINDKSDNWFELDSSKGVPYSEYVGTRVGLSYSISRSELGALTLEGTSHFSLWLPKIGKSHLGFYGELPKTLASGKNPSSAKPDNRKSNRLLANSAPFTRPVELKMEHLCHAPQAADREDPLDPKHKVTTGDDMYLRPESFFSKHAESSDVWEEVHKKTGLPIVADYYTRLYPLDSVQLPRLPLFEALCREGDALGVKWQKDGDFLLGRATSYFWDKIKEVPRRQLERWAQDSAGKDGLPFEDFLEMAQCPDVALDSLRVGQGVWTCWGLEEWERIAVSRDGRRDTPIAGTSFRKFARCLANFPFALRDQIQQPGGVVISALPLPQQQDLIKALSVWTGSLETLRDSQCHVDYVPAGRYVWHPAQGRYMFGISARQVIPGKTAEEALAAAQKIDPTADKNQIGRSRGVFAVEIIRNGLPFQVMGTPLTTLQ